MERSSDVGIVCGGRGRLDGVGVYESDTLTLRCLLLQFVRALRLHDHRQRQSAINVLNTQQQLQNQQERREHVIVAVAVAAAASSASLAMFVK